MNPLILILAAQAAAAAQPPLPPTADAATVERFRACAALAISNPDQAVETANAWRTEGGGIYARQCLGLAYAALERWSPAATVFDQAAREAIEAGDSRGVDFWVQSGNAWLAAGEPTRAVLAFDAALTMTGITDEMQGEIHLDRARAMVALGNIAAARQSVDRALQLVAADPFAWYMSAALARRANDLARAQADIAQALERAPDNPDIVLLAGTLAGQAGNMAEAERRYRQVAEQAPDTEAGRQARESLATLREVEVPAPATPAPTPPRLN